MKVFSRFLVAALVLAPAAGHADVHPSGLFGDNMVLQRGVKIPVWGTADPVEKVTVTLGAQSVSTVAGTDGHWRVSLAPLPAGGPFTLTLKGKNTITLQNVLLGDVWLCSGQSNMQYAMAWHPEFYTADIAASDDPLLRTINIRNQTAPQPLEDLIPNPKQVWVAASPGQVPYFTAVGYYFARELRKELKVPIGIIHSSWGGTNGESWVSREALSQDPELNTLADTQIAALQAHPDAPPQNTASYIYNAQIAPLMPFAIKGVVWYQGESNAGRGRQYRKILPTLIGDWRSRWGEGRFPFYIVQLANYGGNPPQPSRSAWAELREAQLLTAQTVPNAGLAVTVDIGEGGDIHPKDKQDVGKRLALTALGKTYRRKTPSSGPLFIRMTVTGGTATVSFTHTDGGLFAKGGPLKYFAAAGDDGKFVWADAQIKGDRVLVSSPQVAHPTAVRYAWADNPEGANLYNGAGLPASPFRTDTETDDSAPAKNGR